MNKLAELNRFLEETEAMTEFELTAHNVNYKDQLLESYRLVEDPYHREIEELNYEQNPGDPDNLIKDIKLRQ